MALNKVVYKNRTLMDLTNTTAVESDVLNGKVFYKADGSAAMGTNGNSLQLQLKNFSTGDYTSPQSAYQVEIGPMSLICAKTSDDGGGGGSGVGYVWQDENGYVHLSDQPAAQLITRPLIVAQNGTYTPANGSAYSSVTVSVPQPSGTLNITENNTYDVTNYANAVVNVHDSVSKKQVNFIDYDGTLLYSYSKNDWQNITTLPDNPSHTGLTAQGWNWTKNQIDAQLVAVPDGVIWVGQMYITDDEKTRIYIHLEQGNLHPYLGICPNGTVSVDWGDNSISDTLTGTSLTTVKTVDHTYANNGDYIITLTVSNGSFQFYGVSNTSYLLRKDTSTTTIVHRKYTNTIQKIEIGANVNIGNYAFNFCYSLKSITIPNNVTSIGTYAFQNCYSLLNVIIPNSIASLGSYAFNNCYSLEKIAIPSEITSINSYTFQYCCNLSSITISNSITTIGGYAFRYCSSLKNIIIPNRVTSIGNYAFANCLSLLEIVLPNSVTSIGTYAFSTCYSLTDLTIPSDVTSLNNYMFQNCYSLENIIISDEITSIPSYIFSGCYSIVKITIPSGVTSIAASAFSTCYSLVKITIPSGVTSIAASAFSGCYGLAEIHFEPTTPPTCANINAWSNIPTDCKIYVPTGSLESYTTAENYPSSQTYTYIEE